MTHISKAVHVGVDPGEVMEYISDVGNHPAFITALKTVSNIQGDREEPSHQWNWVFSMAGVDMTGGAETTRYEAGKVFAYKTTGDIAAEFTYAAAPADGGTDLTIEVDYEVPDNALAAIADRTIIERLNDNIAAAAAENLKVILEG
jgi:uncharacterized membrane protein